MGRIATSGPAVRAGAARGPAGPIDAPSGPAVIAGERGAPSLTVGGRGVAIGDEWMPAGFERRAGAPILAALHPGGTACGTLHAWLDTRPGRLGPSGTFGTRARAPDVARDDETVTMPSREVASAHDGRTGVREPALGRGPSGAGPVAREGAHPSELPRAPDREAALAALVEAEALEGARAGGDVSAGMAREGGGIVGRGCRPPPAARAARGSRSGSPTAASSSRSGVAIRADGEVRRLRGDPGGAPPPSLAAPPAGD